MARKGQSEGARSGSDLVQAQLLKGATPTRPLVTQVSLWLQLRTSRWEDSAGDFKLLQALTHRHILLASTLASAQPHSFLAPAFYPPSHSLILSIQQMIQSSSSGAVPRAPEHWRKPPPLGLIFPERR